MNCDRGGYYNLKDTVEDLHNGKIVELVTFKCKYDEKIKLYRACAADNDVFTTNLLFSDDPDL